MIQEIITYIIVATAICIAIIKIRKKFTKKHVGKKPSNNSKFSQHNCSECSADCMLRNTINPENLKEVKICRDTKITSKNL